MPNKDGRLMTAFVRYFFNFDALKTPLNKCGAAYHLLVRCVKTRLIPFFSAFLLNICTDKCYNCQDIKLT